MDKVYTKNIRTIDLYARLCEGKAINKTEEAERFHVDERSIQRDIDDIRAYLSERASSDSSEQRKVVYDRQKKGFVLIGNEAALMSNSEILAVSKILLESRAFSKKEMGEILNKLVSGCVPLRNMKLVSDLLANEKFHYIELTGKANTTEMLWELGSAIKGYELLEITYCKQDLEEKPVKRIIEPLALLFSEYYFYLNANIVEKNGEDEYIPKYNYPAVFRIDRIQSFKKLNLKFKLPYANRFQEGEFRKRVQFMYPGGLMRISFRYSGQNVNAILDRLPTARVVSTQEDGCIVEAEVFGKGIMMWLLSQGDKVEILRPQKLRSEMREILLSMLQNYTEE